MLPFSNSAETYHEEPSIVQSFSLHLADGAHATCCAVPCWIEEPVVWFSGGTVTVHCQKEKKKKKQTLYNSILENEIVTEFWHV